MDDDILNALLWCLDQGLPSEITSALLALAADDIEFDDAWHVWDDSDHWSPFTRMDRRREFADAVKATTDHQIVTCEGCESWGHTDESTVTGDGENVCDPCIQNSWSACGRCAHLFHDDNMYTIADTDGPYCDSCRDGWCSYCEYCDEWYRYDHDFDHDDGEDEEEEHCDCHAPHMRFRFPANGDGTILNDKRLTVTLPAGTIDETGLCEIRALLQDVTYRLQTDGKINPDVNIYAVVAEAMNAIGDLWQAKRGNYTRRLSRELYANHKVKIPDGVITQIGNLARQYSTDTSSWQVEFTRDLNLNAAAFCHSGSCWWQGYYQSRCALKQWGGLGIRTFDEDNNPVGRAWIQPLDDEMNPTHDTMSAHAYIVYNCYGELDGAKAARIVAHLTSHTYRKVEFDAVPQYVNGNQGWLVADETVTVDTTSITVNIDCHDTCDATSIAPFAYNQEVSA